MRCDDNYQWGGCYLHGSYDPDVTPESLIDDLLVYCILAHRADAVPSDWDWSALLRFATEFIIFAFEESDAMERWGSENGRSLRFTGTQIYRSPVDKPGKSKGHVTAEGEITQGKGKLQNQVGGDQSWVILLDNLKMCSRFAIELS